jgi:hypothetical protein
LHGCGQTHIDSLPGLIATAWPTATPIEIRAVAHALLHGNKTANLRPTVAKASDTTVWHRLHQVLDIVYKLVPSVANIQPFLVANRIKPSDVSPEALKLHKLHVIERTPTKLVARQATELNATNSATLLDALKKRGVAGVPLSTVYAEYEGAYEHVHKYPPAVAHRSLPQAPSPGGGRAAPTRPPVQPCRGMPTTSTPRSKARAGRPGSTRPEVGSCTGQSPQAGRAPACPPCTVE